MKNSEEEMQIRKVTAGCFLSAAIIVAGVLGTLVVKNIGLQKNSMFQGAFLYFLFDACILVMACIYQKQ